MKLTTISTLGVVVALAAASLLPENYGLAEEASVMGAAGAKNETASFNATAADLLSDNIFDKMFQAGENEMHKIGGGIQKDLNRGVNNCLGLASKDDC